MSEIHPRLRVTPLSRVERASYYVFAVVNAGIAVIELFNERWFYSVNFFGFAVVWFMFPMVRRTWEKGAWMRGHWDTVEAAREAVRRGFDFHDWLDAELERNVGAHLDDA